MIARSLSNTDAERSTGSRPPGSNASKGGGGFIVWHAGASTNTEAIAGFSERDFYLAEFRGRTVAIALREADASGLECLQSVVADLVANSTRVVLLSPEGGLLARALGDRVITSGASDWVGSLWCLLREHGCAGINLGGEGNLATACRRAAERLGFAKLVWIDAVGPAAGDPAPTFARVAALREQLRATTDLALPILSLGMSGDLEAAIAAGSTMVRIGTALFGERA